MTDIKHILVPTDGSETSLKAAAFAGDIARALNAKVTVLLVMDGRSIVAEAWNAQEPDAVETVRKRIEDRASQEDLPPTNSAIGEVPAGTETVHLWGNPADEIVDFVKKNDIDLIVMGSHGRGVLKRAILGSVSHAVVNTAECAVTIVR